MRVPVPSRVAGLRLSWRPGLLAQVSVLTFVCLAALGLVLGNRLRAQADDRGLAQARSAAELIARVSFAPQLTASDLTTGVSADVRAGLDRAVQAAKRSGEVVRVKIWSPTGTVVYSDDRAAVGRSFRLAADVREALEGHSTADVSSLQDAEQQTERQFGTLVETHVPLRLRDGDPPAGVFEIYSPYGPIAAAVHSDVRRTYLLLAGALATLFALLFRIVSTASRRLREHACTSAYQARHDPLTGLRNRRALLEELEQRLERRDSARTSTVLLLVDLDGFKEINDTLGHRVGDEVLCALAVRLRAALRPDELVFRLGGDEFAIVTARRSTDEELFALADCVRSSLAEPITFGGMELRVDASIGVACGPQDGETPDMLLQHADIAMYRAKEQRSGCERYAAEHDPYSRDRLTLLAELRTAFDQDQLVVAYQPKFSLPDRRLVGVEALVRWQHPRLGLLGPAAFLPLAERAGLIRRLTLIVLGRALQDAAAWRKLGLAPSVAVNVSAADFLDDDLPVQVARLLSATGQPAASLQIELTESAVLIDPEGVGRVLARLGALGVGVSLDDFGTGYSSLSHLQRLPVTELKIDQSFVRPMCEDAQAAAIVRATVDLARALGLRVVAEGIEDEATLRAIEALGCHEAQGYHLGRPQPAASIVALDAALRARDRHAA